MTFYNPNVQSNFEANLPGFPILEGKTFASIDFEFSTPGVDGRQYAVSLNDRLLQNYLGNELSSLLSELVYRSWQGSIVTPADFIQKVKDISSETSEPENFYLTYQTKLLIEKLLLSPNCPFSSGKINLYDMVDAASHTQKKQTWFSLYEKLQLIEFLLTHLHFHPDGAQLKIQEQKHYIKVIVRTK